LLKEPVVSTCFGVVRNGIKGATNVISVLAYWI
jgi:hypothetical protein